VKIDKKIVLTLLVGICPGFLLAMNEQETPEQIRARATESQFIRKTYTSSYNKMPLVNFAQYYKKDAIVEELKPVFTGQQTPDTVGLIAEAILAGCDVKPLLANNITKEFIHEVCHRLARKEFTASFGASNFNLVDEKRTAEFISAVIKAGKTSASDLRAYCVSHLDNFEQYKLNKILNNLAGQPKSSWQQWCAQTTSPFAKKTICALVLGATAVAVGAKMAYKRWVARRSVDIRIDLKVTVKNNTGVNAWLTMHKQDGTVIEASFNKTETRSEPVADITQLFIVLQDKVKTSLPINLKAYITRPQSLDADLEITLVPVTGWWQFWYRSPYRYDVTWQKITK
jgi:hypothetical protein